MVWTWVLRAGLLTSGVGLAWALWPVQEADPDFRPQVPVPAVAETSPVVIVDEGHFNVHTATGRYRPFAQLLHADGFRVLRSEGRITPEALRRADVFVAANPLGVRGAIQHVANLAGLERLLRLQANAYAEDEVATLAGWVYDGGRALIAADHAPAGPAAQRIAAAFGVVMSGWWAEDVQHHDPASGITTLVFSRDNGLLADHPINNGRHPGERVNRVMTFTGQSVRPPPHGQLVLRFGDTAREYPYRISRDGTGRSVTGAGQAVALRHGRGRIVILGEAAAWSAQLVQRPDGTTAKMGINREGVDNAQFVLNVLHWLMGLLD